MPLFGSFGTFGRTVTRSASAVLRTRPGKPWRTLPSSKRHFDILRLRRLDTTLGISSSGFERKRADLSPRGVEKASTYHIMSKCKRSIKYTHALRPGTLCFSESRSTAEEFRCFICFYCSDARCMFVHLYIAMQIAFFFAGTCFNAVPMITRTVWSWCEKSA